MPTAETILMDAGAVMENSLDTLEQARAMGVSDPQLWFLIVGSLTVMLISSLRQIGFKGMVMAERAQEHRYAKEMKTMDLEHDRIRAAEGLGVYAGRSPRASSVDEVGV